MTDENSLAHFGVKGMRWGVRKGVGTPRAQSDDYRDSREIKRKSLDSLSNAELQRYNKRMELETKFIKSNPSTVNRGKQLVTGALAAGTTLATVYNLVNSKAGQAAIKFVTNAVFRTKYELGITKAITRG